MILREAIRPFVIERSCLCICVAGYTNFLLAHVMTEHECHAGTQLVQAYRRFVLQGAGLLEGALAEGRKPVDAGSGKLTPVVVTFVSRRPYSAHGIDHPFMGRQVDNEEAVMEAMASFGAHRVAVKRVDFAGMDVQEQLRIAANTEVMVSRCCCCAHSRMSTAAWTRVLIACCCCCCWQVAAGRHARRSADLPAVHAVPRRSH